MDSNAVIKYLEKANFKLRSKNKKLKRKIKELEESHKQGREDYDDVCAELLSLKTSS